MALQLGRKSDMSDTLDMSNLGRIYPAWNQCKVLESDENI
jgi:hypothetical protein